MTTLGMAGTVAGYIFGLAVLGVAVPGPKVLGAVLSDGTRVTYKLNGLRVAMALLSVLSIASSVGIFRASTIAENGGVLFTTTTAFSLLVSFALLATGYLSKSKSASLQRHTSGNIFKDWWFGVQLNPRFMGLDFKFFWIRAGMIGWLIVSLPIAAKQFELRGSVSLPMALVQTFYFIYIVDFFWYEECMTSTWDIIAERFGFMLVFGDIVWIPFTFSIQAWWLLNNEVELTRFAAVFNVVIFTIGFTIFRGANRQKHIFKRDSKALIWNRPPKLIGGKLLASGYWGIARHCNYLGDLLVAFSFSLPCGTRSPIPYFYPLYLFILLIWRERRDEARCREKYKDIWEEYCRTVPWRICPYLY